MNSNKNPSPRIGDKERYNKVKAYGFILLAIALVFSLAIWTSRSGEKKDASEPYFHVGEKVLTKVEYDFFKNTLTRNFIQASTPDVVEGIDFSKDLYEQEMPGTDYTWGRFFDDRTEFMLREVYYINQLAEKEYADTPGYNEIDKDKLKEDFYSRAQDTISKFGITEEQYIKEQFGPKATRENIDEVLGDYLASSAYSRLIVDSEELDQATLQNYYSSHKKDLDTVDYRIFYFSTWDYMETESENTGTPDQKEIEKAKKIAKEEAQKFFDGIYDEETFKSQAKDFASEEERKLLEKEDLTLMENISSFQLENELAQWLFSDEREKNSTAILESSDDEGYMVVFFLGRQRDDSPTANIIQIDMATDIYLEDGKIVPAEGQTEEDAKKEYDEAKKNLEERIENFKKDWDRSNKSEEEFESLAKAYSDNWFETSGRRDNLTKYHLNKEVSEWVFDEERKSGDFETFNLEDGFTAVYYVEEGEPEWVLEARDKIGKNMFKGKVEEGVRSLSSGLVNPKEDSGDTK